MLLSPRLLIFDAYQLVLLCEEIGFEPAVPTGIGFEPLCERLPSSIFGAPKHHEILLKEQPDEEITTTWFSIQRDEVWVSLINEYSGRHLSIFDDRLPALSAIAHELSIFWGGTYVAGFWKEALIKHLGWSKVALQLREKKSQFVGVGFDRRIGRVLRLLRRCSGSDQERSPLVQVRSPLARVKAALLTARD